MWHQVRLSVAREQAKKKHSCLCVPLRAGADAEARQRAERERSPRHRQQQAGRKSTLRRLLEIKAACQTAGKKSAEERWHEAFFCRRHREFPVAHLRGSGCSRQKASPLPPGKGASLFRSVLTDSTIAHRVPRHLEELRLHLARLCVLFFFGLGMEGGRGAQISGLRYILTPVGHERPQAAHLHTYPCPSLCHVAM